MNTIFNGKTSVDDVTYDYSGVWIRGAGKIAWKAVVRNAAVVCRPSGSFDDEVTDTQARQVIRELVRVSIQDVIDSTPAAIKEGREVTD